MREIMFLLLLSFEFIISHQVEIRCEMLTKNDKLLHLVFLSFTFLLSIDNSSISTNSLSEELIHTN